jgi:hypothetical protein
MAFWFPLRGSVFGAFFLEKIHIFKVDGMLGFFIYLFLPCLLGAQDAELPVSSPFPLGPVLVEAFYGDGRWRPDWPAELAPDAFTVEGAREIAVELHYTGGPAALPLLSGYRWAADSAGRLTAFPAALPLDAGEGGAPGLVFAQVELRRNGEGGILELGIRAPASRRDVLAGEAAGTPAAEGRETAESETPAETLWSVLFPLPQFPEPSPEPVKVQCGEAVFYVLFNGGGGWIAETWYDPWGNFAAYFKTLLGSVPAGGVRRVLGLEGEGYNRDYRYESGGHLSEYSGDQGRFSALYDAQGRPRYRISGRSYGLQWDEEGRLAEMRDLGPVSGLEGSGPEGSGELFPASFRYEYEMDSRGNWVRRREISLYLRGNLLLPERMGETIRRIDYAEGD